MVNRFHQPAISAYAPASRNPLLHYPSSLFSNNHNHQQNRKKTAIVTLYLLLKFWDTPLLQKFFQKIVATCNNTNITNYIFASLFAKKKNDNNDTNNNTTNMMDKRSNKMMKVTLFLIARSVIKVIETLRIHKIPILNVHIPKSIRKWVVEVDNINSSSSSLDTRGGNYRVGNSIHDNSYTINPSNTNDNSNGNNKNNNNNISVKELEWHGKQINTVLRYWFGQYTPDKAQKHLWMIASSSQEQLNKVDTDIHDKFCSLLTDLSSCGGSSQVLDLWCGRRRYDNDSNNNNNNNDTDNDENDDFNNLYGWRGKLAAIILLDQMSRHIHRYNETNTKSTLKNLQSLLSSSTTSTSTSTASTPIPIPIPIPKQSILDNIALNISKELQQDHKQEISCGMIPTPMLIFSLMPFRHASTIQTVGYVQRQVEDIATLNSIDMEHMVRRFRRATNRRMAVLQDEARRAGKKTFYNQEEEEDDNGDTVADKNSVNKEGMVVDTDGVTTFFSDEDILEFHPFAANIAGAEKHSIVKTIIDFLEARGIHKVRKKNAAAAATTSKSYYRDTPVLVSLSGGVDSMVIAHALAFIRDQCGYDQLYLVSVHIDYGNRPESAAEARFVKDYALNIISFDSCIVRRIDEVTRGETKRDEYEKVSRNVRYDLYRSTIVTTNEICTNNNPNRDMKDVGVMLGHHRGDVVENVISNSNKGCGPLDLSGMTDVSQNDGVMVYRPLLPLDKEDVYDYSHTFGVPYFKDTTPHWSTRGKLRNKLIPLLEEVYGDGCLGNLAKLAEESDEARDLFNKSAFRPFMDTVVHYPMGVVFSTAPFKMQSSYFWKIVLRDLLHSIGLGMFSDKSIASFLARALSSKLKSGWLQCRKDYAVYLMNDGRVMVLYPQYFPWKKSNELKLQNNEAVEFGKQINIGPWSIQADIVSSSDEVLQMKAIKKIEDLMTGCIQYYVEILGTDNGGQMQPLMFIDKFTKDTRPPSWKNVDLKVESTLPILGNDMKTTKILTDTSEQCKTQLARVTLKLNILDSEK